MNALLCLRFACVHIWEWCWCVYHFPARPIAFANENPPSRLSIHLCLVRIDNMHAYQRCSCHTALNHLDPYILYKFFRRRISSRLVFLLVGQKKPWTRISLGRPKRKIKKTSRKEARKAQRGGVILDKIRRNLGAEVLQCSLLDFIRKHTIPTWRPRPT